MKAGMSATIHRTRRLGRARLMTGKERRWINPNKGLLKILERNLDMIVSRFLYPHLSRVWTPYSWLLEKRFVLTETSVSPAGWPRKLNPLRVLLISDIHTGIFLKPQTLADLMLSLMERKPDLVTIAGDIVTGHSSEVRPFLDALAPLSRAPGRAWSPRRASPICSWRTIPITFTRPKATECPSPCPATRMAARSAFPTDHHLSATAGSASMRDSLHSVLRCSW